MELCGLSVSLSLTIVRPAKNVWTNQDVVWDVDFGWPNNYVLDGGPDPYGKRQF